MKAVKSICVYCGSRTGLDSSYRELAEDLGKIMADRGIRLVYGAGSIGLMGVIARRILEEGGQVTGIIPGHLDEAEVSLKGLTELHVVENMHIRKKMMFDRSDAFVVLPGGLGTLDELFETTTWKQLGLHGKPIIVVNHKGYWDPFVRLVEHVVDQGFAGAHSLGLYQVVDSVDEIFPALEAVPQAQRASQSELF